MMRCLSIRYPHIADILSGTKVVEYRSWGTPHRGPLLLHASKAPDLRAYRALGCVPSPHDTVGCLVAVCTLTDVLRDAHAPLPFVWCLADVRTLEVPVPWRGQRGLFLVPAETLEDVHPQASRQ